MLVGLSVADLRLGIVADEEAFLPAVRLLADVLDALGADVAALRHPDIGVLAVSELRLGVQAAISYFTAWRSIELRWKGTGKKPVPPEWRQIGMRQDVLRRRNRHARHPVNAVLNYGYATLESQVRIAIAEVGLDPTIGYLHVCQPGRDSFVYDLMEPHRPRVDRDVLAFIRSQTFTPRDFVIDTKGVCRLHPELARQVAATHARPVAITPSLAVLLKAVGNSVDQE